MNTLSKFENTITMIVWKQQHTPTNNMICGQNNCYSNCSIDHKTNVPLDLKGLFGGPCGKCNHSLWNHHRCHAKWERVIEKQILIDQDMKKKWEAADGVEKVAVLVTASEKVQHDLNQVINRATDHLALHVERYSRLSLSGSFTAQVDSAIKLLEQSCRALEQRGIAEDQLQRVKASSDRMKIKLELLNKAEENAQNESVGIVSQVKKVVLGQPMYLLPLLSFYLATNLILFRYSDGVLV